MKNPKEIGETLKEARLKKGYTPEQISKETRVQARILDALERGVAREILSKVYILLFLRKYAVFLGLPAKELCENYRDFDNGKDEQMLDIARDPLAADIDMRKFLIPAIWVLSFLISVFLLFALAAKTRSFYLARKSAAITAAQFSTDKKAQNLKKIFPVPKNKSISLSLSSSEDAWMRITQDGKTVFEGTLRKNREKSWVAAKSIMLWVGRAEVIDFTINGKPIGKIGKGTLKNVVISHRGLKIGNKWLVEANN